MADVPANASTTAQLAGFDAFGYAMLSYTGELETRGDVDWVRLDVVAGRTYIMTADLQYSVYNQSGPFPIKYADGTAVVTTSPVTDVFQFTATETGPVYIEVRSNYLPVAGYLYDIMVISPGRTVESVPFGGDYFDGTARALTQGSATDDRINVGANGIAFGDTGDDLIYLHADGGGAHGGMGSDTLVGDAASDILFGGHGDDIIQGRGGGDFIWGEHGRDVVLAGEGDDTVHGGEGEDYLSGEEGNDTLDGGSGADTMSGREGDDRYIVDHIGDVVYEYDGDGFDTVVTSVTHELVNFVHIERLETSNAAGTAAINLYGSDTGQIIEGNDGKNFLAGLSGDDTLIGNGGADALSGGGGTDTASYVTSLAGVTASLTTPSQNTGDAKGDTYSSIENLTGTRLNDILTGNALANAIAGGSGADTLNGLGGSDRLAGGGGRDHFVFNTALGSTNVDRITDFAPIDDTFRLDNAIFVGLGEGALNGVAFKNLDAAAADSNDRILYRQSTGEVFFDRDGSGGDYAAIRFAVVTAATAVTAADFLIV